MIKVLKKLFKVGMRILVATLLILPSFAITTIPSAEADITGSTLVSSSTYTSGTTQDLVFTATNNSADSEYIVDIDFDFPVGITVNSATSFVPSFGNSLLYDGTTGDGAQIHWNDPGVNGINDGQAGVVTVNVTIGVGFIGDIDIPFQFDGNGTGSAPHTMNGIVSVPKTVPTFTVDTKAEFEGGTTDGNIFLDDTSHLDTLSPGLTHNEDAEFNQSGYRNYGASATGDSVKLQNTGIATYSPVSSPQFLTYSSGGSAFSNSLYDSANSALFAPSQGQGMYVVSTNGTIDQSDDTIVAQYKTVDSIGTSVELQSDYVTAVAFDGNYMYLSSASGSGGIDVIDTQGTFLDGNDDVIVAQYNTGSTPALSHSFVYGLKKDTTSGLIYAASFAGLDVIDESGTPGVIGDDVDQGFLSGSFSGNVEISNDHVYVGTSAGLVAYNRNLSPSNVGGYTSTSYNIGSSPAISSNFIRSMQVDGNHLYIETFAGLDVIDMGADSIPGGVADTLLTAYNSGNLLPEDNVNDSTLDLGNNRIYIAQDSGLSTISFGVDTFPGGGDDSLITTYTAAINPALYSNGVNDVSISPNGWLALSGNQSTMLIDPAATFSNNALSGTFIGPSLPIATTPYGFISHTETIVGDQTVSTQTRAGDDSVFFFDDHDDETLPTLTSGSFSSFAEVGTSLTASDSSVCSGFCAVDWEVSENPDHFSQNSLVSARVRFNSGSGSATATIDLQTDQGESVGSSTTFTTGVWQTISVVPTARFNEVGVAFQSSGGEGGSGNAGDTVDIDWVKVDVHDASWGPWSAAYTTAGGEFITTDTSGMTWLQYRVNQTSDDAISSPEVGSVTLSNFQPTGEYTSQVFDAGFNADWQSLNTVETLVDSTSLTHYTRTGNTATPDGSWSAWEVVNSPIASPDAQYLQFRTDFASGNPAASPILDSVTIGYEEVAIPPPVPNDGSSTIVASPTSIIANGLTTSVVTVTVRDNSNALLPGQTVSIATSAGTLGPVTDAGDGTYTATLTSSTTAETATISYIVNDDPFSDTASVVFTASVSDDNATILPATLVSEQDVSISIIPDKGVSSPIETIRYTLDGSVPTLTSAAYTAPFTISRKGTTVVTWKAYSGSNAELDSGEEHYYLPNTNITPTCHFPDTEQCYGPQSFTFTTAEADEKILYTTDGTHPILDDPIYTEPDPNTEEFFAGAREVEPGDTLDIGENTKVRFASKNRFGQISPIYYRHSVLNFPHVLTLPDAGANAHMLGYNYAGSRTEAPNFILEEFEKRGASMTTGDLNGDGRDEIIVSPGKGSETDIYIYSYHKDTSKSDTKDIELILLAHEKNVYGNENIKTGLSLVAADINNDGKDEIITVPKEGAESHVLAFQYKIDPVAGGESRKYLRRTGDADFLAYGFDGDYTENYTGGAEIAAADLDGDGRVEIITASDGGQVRVFDKRGNQTFSLGFHPYGKLTRRQLFLATGDVTGDGIDEIITLPKHGNPHVLFVNRFGKRVFTPNFIAPVNKGQEENALAVADIDFDGKIEVLIQDKDTDGKPVLKVFDPENKKAKPFQIKPNYPGYTGGLTTAVGIWSGSR